MYDYHFHDTFNACMRIHTQAQLYGDHFITHLTHIWAHAHTHTCMTRGSRTGHLCAHHICVIIYLHKYVQLAHLCATFAQIYD